MPGATSLRFLLATRVGWLDRRPQEAVAYLLEENRILHEHVHGQIRLTDEERRRLAMHGHRLGRRRLLTSRRSSRPTQFSAGIKA